MRDSSISADTVRPKVGKLYGFSAPIEQAELFGPVSVPKRRKSIDARFTFGDKTRTLPLLIIHIRGEANADQVARCVPRTDVESVRQALQMFKAFGILSSRRVSRGIAYRFNDAHPLAKDVRDILKDLDGAMPQWRVVAENDMLHPRVRRRENRSGRRKPNRWKW